MNNCEPLTDRRPATLSWTRETLALLDPATVNEAPPIEPSGVAAVAANVDVWDAWPLADPCGRPVPWHGGELWFALAAPSFADPEQRHAHARIHHFHRTDGRFIPVGTTFADGMTSGSREWSGSARLEQGRVTLFFTAAGVRGEATPSFRQRLYASDCRLTDDRAAPFTDWTTPVELFAADGIDYRPADEVEGRPGTIKAFRDPAHFRDADGTDYVLFTGSSARRPGTHDGVIGMARGSGASGRWTLLPPLVDASATCNELERPHIVRHQGLLYLFWSSQRGVFAPGIAAPTGLYGAVAEALEGPWQLLNGHGLVVANPRLYPTQAYSWWVLPDLSVASFVDYWGSRNVLASADDRRAQFGGTFAPFLNLRLVGDRATLAPAGD